MYRAVMGKALKLPKTKCCVSSTRCDRCPIRMLKEGSLPAGYGVHKRKLVRVEGQSKKKVKKAELAAAVKKQKKSAKKQLAA
ncbi:MAG TPA: hypothetical protein VFE07_07085 [Marmoricola sp.]|jgi:hypothetical protein|nr:hypothetical protein [Marmoricola sp.]